MFWVEFVAEARGEHQMAERVVFSGFTGLLVRGSEELEFLGRVWARGG